MVPQKSGLIVAISGYVGVTYTYGVVFGTCKSAVDRMARDMAIELQAAQRRLAVAVAGPDLHRAGASAICERNPAMKQLTVTNPVDRLLPEFPGRVIAALATDPEHHEAVRRHLHHRRAGARTTASPTSTAG